MSAIRRPETRAFRSNTRAVAAAIGAALLVGAIATAAAQQGPSFSVLAPGAVNAAQKALAQKVAHDTLSAWKAHRVADMSAFSQGMINALPPAKQQAAQIQIAGMFGDYQSLSFHSAAVSPQMPGVVIYRFRGAFTKARPEVRVVMDASNKVAGFWVRPWNDTLM